MAGLGRRDRFSEKRPKTNKELYEFLLSLGLQVEYYNPAPEESSTNRKLYARDYIVVRMDTISEKLYGPELAGDPVMIGKEKGGIDLTSANMHLQTQSSNGEIKFHLDGAMLKQFQNTPGFVPVIINIQPMTDLREFLGLYDSTVSKL